ncbi:DUF6204 family protein [Streptomyces mayteni]
MFRVTIRGRFGALSDADRARLTATDLFQVAFTEAGTFTHDSSLTAFTFRAQVPAARETDGEPEAKDRAVAALEAHGFPHRILRVAVTDMRAIRIRRKGGRR